MLLIYGLRNCNTCRQAINWSTSAGLKYKFFDFREDPVSCETLKKWILLAGWMKLLNKRSTTWRRLKGDTSGQLTEDLAENLMMEYPALIKRPLFCVNERFFIGFSEGVKLELLQELQISTTL